MLRVQQFAGGYNDSAWVQSGSFAISAIPSVSSILLSNLTLLAGGSVKCIVDIDRYCTLFHQGIPERICMVAGETKGNGLPVHCCWTNSRTS